MELEAQAESWPIAGHFTIARGSRTVAEVLVLTLREGDIQGRGEATPYPRYGSTVSSCLKEAAEIREHLQSGSTLEEVLASLPPGPTRNALDSAWLDFQCKQSGQRITRFLQLPDLKRLQTAYTISIASPSEMEAVARKNASRPLLKVKTGADAIVESVAAVRRGAPDSAIIVDANESWPSSELVHLLDKMLQLRVRFVEQPLPADEDAYLAGIAHPLPIVADESAHTAENVADLKGRYDGINIKLDKTGGLTEALRMKAEAQRLEMLVMCGCMLGTSLAMAPAMVLAQDADAVDLDGPLLLAEDREAGITYEGSDMLPYPAELWG